MTRATVRGSLAGATEGTRRAECHPKAQHCHSTEQSTKQHAAFNQRCDREGQ